jgi:catechol 2,3-dioxygenase-like lactoylglutathione lyase family enzyme
MPTDDLAASVRALKPFLPAKDFATSKRFYAALGFRVDPLGDDLAEMRLGQHSFLLQNYFVEAWAANCMMHVMVTNLEAWWEHIASLDLPSHYQVQSPRAPKLEPWGLNTAYVFDPSGVLWHFAQPAS